MIYTAHRMIIAAPSLGAAAETLLAYGKGVVDVESVLVVVNTDDCERLQSAGVPLNTPWCRDGEVNLSVINFMRAQFGLNVTVSDAVAAYVDGVAVDPRARTVSLPAAAPEVYNEFHQGIEVLPTVELREDGTQELREDGGRELRDGPGDPQEFGDRYQW